MKYKFIYDNANNIEEILNEYGKEGGNVVSIQVNQGGFYKTAMTYVTLSKK